MKIVIPGGSGQIGRELARRFVADGHEVVVLTRGGHAGAGRSVPWDGKTLGPWTAELDGADVVINLAGRSVNCRYHAANRRAIMDSRINSTRVLGDALAQAPPRPRVWLQSSTATIYAHTYDAPNDEDSGVLGGKEPGLPDTWKFSYDVANTWERTAVAAAAKIPGTRLVLLRTAILMNRERSGTLDLLRRVVRLRLGGKIGDGRQFMSWIHGRDFYRSLLWMIAHEEFAGPVNVAAPHPLPQAQFMRELRAACGVGLGLPATRWMVEAGMFLIRSESELILKSRRVVPGRLLKSGFRFEFPQWHDAARDLCGRSAPNKMAAYA